MRGEESKTMMPFYHKHAKCMEKNPANVETKDDQYQEEPWMAEESAGGYERDDLKEAGG